MPKLPKEIPISDLPSYADGDETAPMTWDFGLPQHIDTERLVIRGGNLAPLMSVAAFRQINVHEYWGEQTKFTPNISGMTSNGEATASLSGELNQAESGRSSLRDDYGVGSEGAFLMASHGKTSPVIHLNRAELVSRVVDDKREGGKTGEAAWAGQLDRALRTSLRTSARKHLAGRNTGDYRAYGASYYGLASVLTTSELLTNQAAVALMVTALASGIIIMEDEVTIKHYTGYNMSSERRWSLTPLVKAEWDRYLAADALTRTMPLIRARK